MKTSPLRRITEGDVRRILTAPDANRLVEYAFRNLQKDTFKMPPKIYLPLPRGDFRAMPVYTRLRGGIAGIKWISVFPQNARRRLPSVMGTFLLNDAATGEPLAVMGANVLTAFRTGSAGAVASKYLAAPGSESLTLVGAGVQAEFQLRCHMEYFSLKRILVWSPAFAESQAFVKRLRRTVPNLKAERDLQTSVRSSDIIATCTPSRKPLLKARWIKPGTHINAIGADAPGKRELESALLKKARIFIDDWEQALHSGEVNVPLSRGELRKNSIRGTLTDVIRKRCGRKSKAEITVFDSTGLAVQDIVLADHVYRKFSHL